MERSRLRAINRAANGIQGWFSSEAAGLFLVIDDLQRRLGVTGDLFEIGTHHGRSAILLGNLTRPGERLGVCDIFGAQELNASTSGRGDRGAFDFNMAQFAPQTETVVFEKRSDDLSVAEIGGPYRIFHIDGGHLAEEARLDIELGATVLARGGAIVVDDPFRAEWPGVTEGILDFCRAQSEFVPVVLGFNKLVIVRDQFVDAYRERLDGEAVWDHASRRRFRRKTLPIAGHDVTIYFVPSSRSPRLRRLGTIAVATLRRAQGEVRNRTTAKLRTGNVR